MNVPNSSVKSEAVASPGQSNQSGNTDDSEQKELERRREQITFRLQVVIMLALFFTAVLATTVIAVRLYNLAGFTLGTREYRYTVLLTSEAVPDDPAVVGQINAETVLGQAQDTLDTAIDVKDRADDAVNSAETILSFLEGATVLVGLALGAAAYVGFRNSQETREEFQELSASASKQLDELRKDKLDFQTAIQAADQYKEELQKIPTFRSGIEHQIEKIAETVDNLNTVSSSLQENYLDLLQATQELRLKNYEEAYRAVQSVLAREADNRQALYMAGWLENQYIPGKQTIGAEHLRQVTEKNSDWPAARAAYGVVLRRQAEHAKNADEKARLFSQAEGMLRIALAVNPNLIDLNHESFWGPLGGLMRSQGRLEEAEDAYRRACRITPGSSYPAGNLAVMLLRRGAHAEALERFAQTSKLAQAELSLVPNDYYHVMDVAMASLVLGYAPEQTLIKALGEEIEDTVAIHQRDYRREAQAKFDQALDMEPTREMLSVSQRGWNNLREYSPQGAEWDALREQLTIYHKAVDERVQALPNTPDEEETVQVKALRYDDLITWFRQAIEAAGKQKAELLSSKTPPDSPSDTDDQQEG